MKNKSHRTRYRRQAIHAGIVIAFLATAGVAVEQPAHADGFLRCWGRNDEGQCNVPADLGPCSSVADGYLHTIALQSDGAVRCWGAGQASTVYPNFGQSIVPADLGPCSSVAGGGYHSAVVQRNGTIRCWGRNDFGQCNTPPDLGPCSGVAGGIYHSIALRIDGTIRCWGANTKGQCDTPTDLGTCSTIAAGGYHTIALRSNGAVRCWGYNYDGQCNTPADLGACSSIAAGNYHSIALRSDGAVRCWGGGTTNTGNYNFGQSIVPVDLGTCSMVAAGGYHTMVIQSDGLVRCWGAGKTQTGSDGQYGQSMVPSNLEQSTTVAGGGYHSIAIKRTTCSGDLNYDNRADGADLGIVLGQWATSGSTTGADLNLDGTVNGADLGLLLGAWGPCLGSVTAMTPSAGCVAGGTEITITGVSLGTATGITVGGIPATNVNSNSDTSVTATTPPGNLGPAIVRVTTAAGTFTASQEFVYEPASVSAIVPNVGSVSGSTTITLTGAYLALTTGITVGGERATNVTVVNDTTLTALTPPGALGNADVVITGGKGTASVPGGFRYVPVTIPNWATLVEAVPDPAVVSNTLMRTAITASGRAWRVRDTATQMEMLLVPQGTFTMGCTASNAYGCSGDENPTHAVTLTQSFYLGRYEVTQAQWMAKMGSNPSSFQGANYPDAGSRPVETVSWNTIQGYLAATGMRLTTEAEWEYACRAGMTTAFNNGSSNENTVPAIAWFGSNSSNQTHTVGGKAPNALGLHDMSGNVWEWVNDRYGLYSASVQTDPAGPVSGTYRVVRGGSWNDNALYVRSSYRGGLTPGYAYGSIGFRVARSP
jgi:formylglycine-generating enzyme required for sulfatase activity